MDDQNNFAAVSVQDQILKLLEICIRRFRDRPSQKYLEEVAAEMTRRLKIPEVDKYLDGLERRHERFPSMLQIDAAIKKIEQERWTATSNGSAIVKKKIRWVSQKAPGTPPTAEALFELIDSNNTGSGAFRPARLCWKHLTDEELWECYEKWTEGKVHPLLADQIGG